RRRTLVRAHDRRARAACAGRTGHRERPPCVAHVRRFRPTRRRRRARAHDDASRDPSGPRRRAPDGRGGDALVRLRTECFSAQRWQQRGSPVVTSANALGVRADDVERWLVRALERWRDASGGAAARSIEPWDWWYEAGAASRRLSSRIPLDRLASLNEEVYA